MKIERINRGVTLVEIVIVIVVIGFLIGGVLKAQEIIGNAKVRAMVDQQNSLKVAWFAFIERYQGLPGDYVAASQHIADAADGNGDGIIRSNESPLVFQHLTGAGYLNCSQCTARAPAVPTARNSPQNEYGGVMSIWSDSQYYAILSTTDISSSRLAVRTGPRIPSNIIAEVDRKLDDGIANTGDFVFDEYDPSLTSGGRQAPLTCMTKSQTDQSDPTSRAFIAPLYWRHVSAQPEIELNCGGSLGI